MSNEAGRRAGGQAGRLLSSGILALALAVWPSGRLSAQVGHEPAASPFRDITSRQGLTAVTGWFFGNQAEVPVGARPGLLVGARLATRLSGPLDLWVTAGRVASSRFVVNPDTTDAERVSGPVSYTLVAADITMGLNLTGAKSWRGLAPYVAFGFGVVTPTHKVVDPGGYEAGTNFTFVPTLGTRLFVARTLAVEAELRDYFIRYEWPRDYFVPTNSALTPVLDSHKYDDRDMTHNAVLSLGLSYRFTF